jgi:hypothetical protein
VVTEVSTVQPFTAFALTDWPGNEGENVNVHWTVNRAVNTLFTGRDDILADLLEVIQGALNDNSPRQQCRIVITGMGGQGKSEICLQLAERVRSF